MPVKEYFVDQSAFDTGLDEDRVPAIGISAGSADTLGDNEELAAALAYINAVRQESRKLPFAVVADIPSSSPIIVQESHCAEERLSSPLSDAVVEYFISLRMLLNKDGIEKRDIVIDFGDDVEENLATADSVSISNAIEDLAEVAGDVIEVNRVSVWLFGLLVYLEEPLLEDTGAALQQLGRFCEAHSHACPNLGVCSLIIRNYFKQR